MRPYLTITLAMPLVVLVLGLFLSVADFVDDGEVGLATIAAMVGISAIAFMAMIFIKATSELIAEKEKAELVVARTQENFDTIMKGFDAERSRHEKELMVLHAGFDDFFERVLYLFVEGQRGYAAGEFAARVRRCMSTTQDGYPRLREKALLEFATEADKLLREYRVTADQANKELRTAQNALLVVASLACSTANALSDSIGGDIGETRTGCFHARGEAIKILIWSARGGGMEVPTFQHLLEQVKEHDLLPPYAVKQIADTGLPEPLRIALLEAIAAGPKKEEPAKT